MPTLPSLYGTPQQMQGLYADTTLPQGQNLDYGEVGKGAVRTIRGMGNQYKALAGQIAEDVAPEFGRNMIADAVASTAADAQAYAPAVGRWSDVRTLNDAWLYGGGQVGQMLPYVPMGMGAAGLGRAATGTLAGAEGAAAASFLPINAGDQAIQLAEDPAARGLSAGQKTAYALGVGGAQSLLEGAIPALGVERLVTRAAAPRTLAQAAGSVATGTAKGIGASAAEEGTQELTSQLAKKIYNPNHDVNWEDVKENAIGGAFGVAPHAAGHAAISTALDTGLDVGGMAARGAGRVAGAAGDAGRAAFDKVAPGARQAYGAVKDYVGDVQDVMEPFDDTAAKAGAATAKVADDLDTAITSAADATINKGKTVADNAGHSLFSGGERLNKTIRELAEAPTEANIERLRDRADFFRTIGQRYDEGDHRRKAMDAAADAIEETHARDDMTSEEIQTAWGKVRAAATTLRTELGGEKLAEDRKRVAAWLDKKGTKYSRLVDWSGGITTKDATDGMAPADQYDRQKSRQFEAAASKLSVTMDKAFAMIGWNGREHSAERSHMGRLVQAYAEAKATEGVEAEVSEGLRNVLDATFGDHAGKIHGAIEATINAAKVGNQEGLLSAKEPLYDLVKANVKDGVRVSDVLAHVREADSAVERMSSRKGVTLKGLSPQLRSLVEARMAHDESLGLAPKTVHETAVEVLRQEGKEQLEALLNLDPGKPSVTASLVQRIREMDETNWGKERQQFAAKAQHDDARLNAAQTEFKEDGFGEGKDIAENQTALSVVPAPSDTDVHDYDLPATAHTSVEHGIGGEIGHRQQEERLKSAPHATRGTSGKPARNDGSGHVETGRINALEHLGNAHGKGAHDDVITGWHKGVVAREHKRAMKLEGELLASGVDVENALSDLDNAYNNSDADRKAAKANKEAWEIFDAVKLMEKKYGRENAEKLRDLYWAETHANYNGTPREFFERFPHYFVTTRNNAGGHEQLSGQEINKATITNEQANRRKIDDISHQTGYATYTDGEGATKFIDVPRLMEHSLGKVRSRTEGIDEGGQKERYEDSLDNPAYAGDMRSAFAAMAISLLNSEQHTMTPETAKMLMNPPSDLLVKRGVDGKGDVTWGDLNTDKKVFFTTKQENQIIKPPSAATGLAALSKGVLTHTARAPLTRGGEPISIDVQALIKHTASQLGVSMDNAPRQVYFALLNEGIKALRENHMVDYGTMPNPVRTDGKSFVLNPRYEQLVIGDRQYTNEDGSTVSNTEETLLRLTKHSSQNMLGDLHNASRLDFDQTARTIAGLTGFAAAVEIAIERQAMNNMPPLVVKRIKNIVKELDTVATAQAERHAAGFATTDETKQLHELNAEMARLIGEAHKAGLDVLNRAAATDAEVSRLQRDEKEAFQRDGRQKNREPLDSKEGPELLATLRNVIERIHSMSGWNDNDFIPDDGTTGRHGQTAQKVQRAVEGVRDGFEDITKDGKTLGKYVSVPEMKADVALASRGDMVPGTLPREDHAKLREAMTKDKAETVAQTGERRKVDPALQEFIDTLKAGKRPSLRDMTDEKMKAWHDEAGKAGGKHAEDIQRVIASVAEIQGVDLATGKYVSDQQDIMLPLRTDGETSVKNGVVTLQQGKLGRIDVVQNGKVVGAVSDAKVAEAIKAGKATAASIINGKVKVSFFGAAKDMPAYNGADNLPAEKSKLARTSSRVAQGEATRYDNKSYTINAKLAGELQADGRAGEIQFNNVAYSRERFGETFGSDHLKALENVLRDKAEGKEPSSLDTRLLGVPRLNSIKRGKIEKYSRIIEMPDGTKLEGDNAEQAIELISKLFNKKDVAKLADVLKDSAGNEVAGKTALDPKHPLGFAIRLSLNSRGNVGSTALHESLHGLFITLGKTAEGKAALEKLTKALTGGIVRQRVANALDKMNLPEDARKAIDADMENDPEEAAAYAFQLWATKDLILGPEADGFFTKVAKFFRNLIGMTAEYERTESFLSSFIKGELGKADFKPSALEQAFAERNGDKIMQKVVEGMKPFKQVMNSVFDSSIRAMERLNLPEATELMQKFTGYGEGQGYIKRVNIESRRHAAQVQHEVLGKFKAEEISAGITEIYDSGAKSDAAKAVMGFIDHMNAYAGRPKGTLPQVFDHEKIGKNRAAFDKAVADFGVKKEGTESKAVLDLISDLGFSMKEGSSIEFLPQYADEQAKWMQTDPTKFFRAIIVSSVKKTEYGKLFKPGEVEGTLQVIRNKGGDEAYFKAKDFVAGMEGKLGQSLSPAVRNMMKVVLTAGNVITLPFALFSAAVDPFHLASRTGNLGDAGVAYAKGFKSIFTTISEAFGKRNERTAEEQFAEELGIVEHAMMTDVLGDVYLGDQTEGLTKKVNDWFFKANFLDGWTRQMRVAAAATGQRFIIEHAKGEGKHSEHYMRELGLKASDVKVDADGSLIITDKIKMALNKFVDESIVRPDQATNAIWMNDPRFMLLAHMKRFTYAFNDVVLHRAMSELHRGNLSPLMMLGASIPAILAADMGKHLLKGDFDTWMNNKSVGRWFDYGMDRSGMNGKMQFGIDAIHDVQGGGTPMDSFMGPDIGLVKKMLGTPHHVAAGTDMGLMGLADDAAMLAYQGFGNASNDDGKRKKAA